MSTITRPTSEEKLNPQAKKVTMSQELIAESLGKALEGIKSEKEYIAEYLEEKKIKEILLKNHNETIKFLGQVSEDLFFNEQFGHAQMYKVDKNTKTSMKLGDEYLSLKNIGNYIEGSKTRNQQLPFDIIDSTGKVVKRLSNNESISYLDQKVYKYAKNINEKINQCDYLDDNLQPLITGLDSDYILVDNQNGSLLFQHTTGQYPLEHEYFVVDTTKRENPVSAKDISYYKVETDNHIRKKYERTEEAKKRLYAEKINAKNKTNAQYSIQQKGKTIFVGSIQDKNGNDIFLPGDQNYELAGSFIEKNMQGYFLLKQVEEKNGQLVYTGSKVLKNINGTTEELVFDDYQPFLDGKLLKVYTDNNNFEMYNLDTMEKIDGKINMSPLEKNVCIVENGESISFIEAKTGKVYADNYKKVLKRVDEKDKIVFVVENAHGEHKVVSIDTL